MIPVLRLRAAVIALVAGLAPACDDGSKARADALEARVAELERRADVIQGALEPLSGLPATIAAQQDSARSIRAEQATLVARLARAEESIAALEAARAGAPTTPPTTPPTTAPSLGASVDPAPASLEVGIPECDEFLRKYHVCLRDHVPEAARKAALDALEQSAKSWREIAGGPGRDALAKACVTAAESTKDATAAMGCTW